jgi:hypothetical protein
MAARAFIVAPLGLDTGWLEAAAARFPVIHALSIAERADIEPAFERSQSMSGEGMVLDLAAGLEASALSAVFARLARLERRVRVFRDLTLKALFEIQLATLQRRPRPRVPYNDRRIIVADPQGGISEQRFTRRQALLGVASLAWKLGGSTIPTAAPAH